mmetsp:Transcript_101928/g.259125  ORF Transcript_101928/g.259125 Transcript_101928/m.259125 type:complete len:203 (+) Transcript_101928:600-1208(+)
MSTPLTSPATRTPRSSTSKPASAGDCGSWMPRLWRRGRTTTAKRQASRSSSSADLGPRASAAVRASIRSASTWRGTSMRRAAFGSSRRMRPSMPASGLSFTTRTLLRLSFTRCMLQLPASCFASDHSMRLCRESWCMSSTRSRTLQPCFSDSTPSSPKTSGTTILRSERWAFRRCPLWYPQGRRRAQPEFSSPATVARMSDS